MGRNFKCDQKENHPKAHYKIIEFRQAIHAIGISKEQDALIDTPDATCLVEIHPFDRKADAERQISASN